MTTLSRRQALQALAAAPAALAHDKKGATKVKKYVRFRHGSKTAYAELEGDTLHELHGSPIDGAQATGAKHKLAAVKLLAPCEPPKIVAVGRNYRSHLGDRQAPEQPELFYKPITALQHPDEPIVLPADSTNVHYEGELVLVIGKRVKNVSLEAARAAIFGVTCGNDVSEREWQSGAKKDLRWWRAKGCDTFAPAGPAIVTGLDYDKLLLQTRLNGEVVQKQLTSDLIFDCAAVVQYASRFVTLVPGDLVYTGTPGQTRKMKPGDLVEVDIKGIGVLRSPVTAG